jgi:hypothetical protein
MPDLQTALTEALKEWGEDDQPKETKMTTKTLPQTFRITSNVTRETFDYVKQNPGVTLQVIKAHVKAKGMNEESAQAVLSNNVRQGYMRRDKFRYWTIVDEYKSLKGTSKKSKLPRLSETAKVVAKPIPEAVKKQTTAQHILDTVNVAEAKKLYVELRKIFEE